VERPLRDEQARLFSAPRASRRGSRSRIANCAIPKNVSLSEDVPTYFRREVLPHVPDAWIDEEKTKTGYEIPFNRLFYVFEPPRR